MVVQNLEAHTLLDILEKTVSEVANGFGDCRGAWCKGGLD